MKKLLVYLRPYRLQAILAPCFKLLEAAFELLVPLIMADIIDIGISSGDTAYILKKCLVLVGLGLCGFASATCAQYFSAKAATGATGRLRHALFAHIQSLSYAELDRLGTATLVTRMTSDMNQVQTGLNLTLRLLLRSPIVVFGAMIMAFTIDVKSALIFAVAIPVLFAVVFAIMLSCIPLYRRVQTRLDGVTGAAQENLSGVRVIRAFTREQTETESFAEKTGNLFSAQQFVGKLSALLNPLTYVIINLAIVAILRVGGVRVNEGVITQGQLIALYNYMSQILVELIKFANLILNITKSVACAGRISQVLDTKSSMVSGADALPDSAEAPELEFRHVSFRYPQAGADALTDISFCAAPGETIGVIGGTGSGKSTLANLIPRFYDATAGCVLVRGEDVKSLRLQALRTRIGIVPQKALLFSGTIRDNLRWGNAQAGDEDLWQALQDAQAAGIQVILFDRTIDADESLYVASIVSDMAKEGQTAVDWLASQNLETYNIIHIQGVMGSAAQIGRTGALDEQVAANDNWNMVTQQTAEWNAETAQQIVQSVIDSGKEFNVIYAENDDMAKGAVAALDKANISHGVGKDVIVMGFDCNKWALEELLAGNWNYDGQCNPFQASYIDAIIKDLENGKTPAEKTIIMDEKGFDASTITQEDVDNYGI